MSMLTRLRKRFPVLVAPKVKAEARLAIAHDILATLDLGRMVARKGTYFELKGITKGGGDNWEAIALGVRLKGSTSCEVCAIGAACVAAVGLYDNAPELEDEWGEERRYGPRYVEDTTMRDVLSRWFSRRQLGLIECAFERSTGFVHSVEHSTAGARAKNFGLRVAEAEGGDDWANTPEKDELVLRAIWQNVIDNNGTFKP